MPRPRRSAAAKAQGAISDHARWADDKPSSRSQRSTMSGRRSNRAVRDDADSADDDGSPHRNVTVKVPSSKLRQATRNGAGSKSRGVSEAFEGGEMLSGKRNRGGQKKYVVESSDDDDEDEEEPQLDDDDENEEMDEDADGEGDMDVDAEGDDADAEEEEEDAEGDVDMDIQPGPAAPTIKISRNGNSKTTSRSAAQRIVSDDDDDDDEELSDPADSEAGDQAMDLGEEDAEGEDDIDLDAEGEDVGDLDSLDGSDQEEPDLTKMSKRQRARFEDDPQDFMELSNEVQAKKVFTQEEQNMRRQEMARRRRNLSEKRNEEVKMETINKLLKKQAPKVNKKAAAAAAAAEASPDGDSSRINPAFIRWTSNKDGCRVSVPTEMIEGPAGKLFVKKGLVGGKMVQEVA